MQKRNFKMFDERGRYHNRKMRDKFVFAQSEIVFENATSIREGVLKNGDRYIITNYADGSTKYDIILLNGTEISYSNRESIDDEHINTFLYLSYLQSDTKIMHNRKRIVYSLDLNRL